MHKEVSEPCEIAMILEIAKLKNLLSFYSFERQIGKNADVSIWIQRYINSCKSKILYNEYFNYSYLKEINIFKYIS